MKKLNCWEFMKCGREAGGKKVQELGACPVSLDTRADGIHGGSNGGRCCWAIVGTFCGGKVQGQFVDKFDGCMNCHFYKTVTKEERDCLSASEIIKIIRKNIKKVFG